jgi:hypothetical protein
MRPDRPPEIIINAILGRKIKVRQSTTAHELSPPLDIFPQRMVNHLHRDLEMKRSIPTGVSKS